ncbi:unnamed protein product [Auanema sp. JU1783]|nr:unnamed protein product [Auanema sp. JU1783]
MLFASVLSILAFYSENECLLVLNAWTFFSISFVISVSVFYVFKEQGSFNDENIDKTKLSLGNIIQRNYGEEHHHLQLSLSSFQSTYQCCGLNGVEVNRNDWTQSTFFLSQLQYPRDRVPLSCCKTCESLQKECGKNVEPTEECTKALPLCSLTKFEYVHRDACLGHSVAENLTMSMYLNTNGCFNVMYNSISSYLDNQFYLGWSLIILTTLQFFLLISMFSILKNVSSLNEY